MQCSQKNAAFWQGSYRLFCLEKNRDCLDGTPPKIYIEPKIDGLVQMIFRNSRGPENSQVNQPLIFKGFFGLWKPNSLDLCNVSFLLKAPSIAFGQQNPRNHVVSASLEGIFTTGVCVLGRRCDTQDAQWQY